VKWIGSGASEQLHCSQNVLIKDGKYIGNFENCPLLLASRI
jgi:hypothetical protein